MNTSWSVWFVGVHTGHLGFYTDYLDSEIDKLVENLKYDTGAKVSYPILNVKITFENGETRTMRALNEATIKRSDRTMVADLTINGVDFERFRGDGITVSTPTGSTAYTNPWEEQSFTRLLRGVADRWDCQSQQSRLSYLGFFLSLSLKKDKIEIAPTRPGFHIISVDNSTYSYRNIAKVEYQIDKP